MNEIEVENKEKPQPDIFNPHDDFLEKVKKETGINLLDLVAMARENDPFYQGTKTHIKQAKWFMNIWEEYGRDGMHLRGLHYKILNRTERWDGKLYKNTKQNWKKLTKAATVARWLNSVNPHAFTDRRNPEPVDYEKYGDVPEFSLSHGESTLMIPNFMGQVDMSLPEVEAELGEEPIFEPSVVARLRPLHYEIWIEKSGLNDVLKPFCRHNALTFAQFDGRPSITGVINLIDRIKQVNKPTKILYISDYDIAGQSMPKAVARKIEFLIWRDDLDIEVSLDPVAITPYQIEKYELPKAPDSEKVELDALEAMHPGEIKKILKDCLTSHTEKDIETEVRQKQEEAEDLADVINQEVKDRFGKKVKELHEEVQKIIDKYAGEMERELESCKVQARVLEEEIADYIKRKVLSTDLPKLQKRKGSLNGDGVLFHSSRNYLDQLEKYQRFQADYEANLKDN